MSRVATPPARWALDDDGIIFPIDGVNIVIPTSANSVDLAVRRNNAPTSIKHLADASGHVTYQQWFWGLQGNFGYYVRRYFRVPSLPSGSVALLQINDNPATSGAYARLTSAGTVELHSFSATPTDTTQGTTVTAMTTGAWWCWELYAKLGAGGADDECAFRLTNDAGTAAETLGPFTGLNLSANMLVGALWGICSSADANFQVNSCDGAINDDRGAANNSYPGPVKNVFVSIPLSDSARGASWQGGGGGTTNMFNGVDNIPPVGVADASATDGSQIKNSNTADVTGNYDANMQSYLEAGATSLQYVSLVQPAVAVASSSATNVTAASTLVSNPTQASEDSWNTGRSAAAGNYGTNWRNPGGTAQNFTPATAPANGTRPVLRVGRRGTEAATLEVCFMGITFEVNDLPAGAAQVILPMSVSPALK